MKYHQNTTKSVMAYVELLTLFKKTVLNPITMFLSEGVETLVPDWNLVSVLVAKATLVKEGSSKMSELFPAQQTPNL